MKSKRPFSDRMSTGLITGFVFPAIVFIVVWLFAGKGASLAEWSGQIADKDVITHFISLCVFPNVFAFLLFNRFDKLYSARGVLGMTIIWALAVFIIKFA